MIYASKANLALKAEGHLSPYSTIFGYMFKYNDEINLTGLQNAHLYGHAISIFEFKNRLWAYDVRYGTMLIGEAKDRNMYSITIRDWVNKTYNVTITESFILDDWAIPQATKDLINGTSR